MKEIKDILTDFQAEPSASCWDTLSSKLDLAMPTAGNTAQAAQGPTTAAKGLSAVATSTKVIATVVSAIVVAGAISIAVISHNHATSDKGGTTDTSAVQTEQTITEESVATLPSTTEVSETVNTTSEPTFATNNPTLTDIQTSQPGELTSLTAVTPVAPETPKQMEVARPSNHEVVASTPKSIAPKPVSTAHVQLPTVAQQSKAVQEDPVIQNMDQETIDWNPPVKLEIPNVFTPNGDGYNDYFVIKGIENCDKRRLVVRNRAGNIVYRNNSYENTWDGSDCPDGTYNYMLIYRSNGIDQTLRGSVTILRSAR